MFQPGEGCQARWCRGVADIQKWGAGSGGSCAPSPTWATLVDCWLVRSFELREERSSWRMSSVSLPRPPPKLGCLPEPCFSLVSQQNFRLVPLRSPRTPALSLFVCLAFPLLTWLFFYPWVHTCHFSLCPISSLCTFSASLSLALGLSYAGNLRRANCPELSVVFAASVRGARGIGDSQAWHLEFLRERHLALPWPCGPWGKYGRDYRFLPSPYPCVTSQWSRDGFNFSWSYV